MGKIATIGDIISKGCSWTGDNNNRCPTYSEIIAKGCTVNGSYQANQLVQLDDISVVTYSIAAITTKLPSKDKSYDLTIYNQSEPLTTVKGTFYSSTTKWLVEISMGTEYYIGLASNLSKNPTRVTGTIGSSSINAVVRSGIDKFDRGLIVTAYM